MHLYETYNNSNSDMYTSYRVYFSGNRLLEKKAIGKGVSLSGGCRCSVLGIFSVTD